MATVTGLTAERMIEAENATIISGEVSNGDLILHTKGGGSINAGSVIGPMGPEGGAFIICTSSSRPSLTTQEEGKVIYETDTKLIRVWTGSSWRLQEKVICTNGTRPSMTAQDEGVEIYETDTNHKYTWNGTTWIFNDTNITVVAYADAAARASASPSPAVGALSYLLSTPGVLWVYENGVWNTVGSPPGSMQPFMGTTAPPNWVLMYGQTITNAQTLYPVLWTLIGSPWKSGSSLIVPDLRGRIPVGKDDMGGVDANRITVGGFNGKTLGATGGDKYLQSHDHSVSDPGHVHNVGENLGGTGTWGMWEGGKAILPTTSSATTGISVNNYGQGSGQNVQPSLILNWILKLL